MLECRWHFGDAKVERNLTPMPGFVEAVRDFWARARRATRTMRNNAKVTGCAHERRNEAMTLNYLLTPEQA